MTERTEQKKLAREDREALRAALETAAAGATPEGASEAAGRLLPLLVPDPAAAPSKSGIRTAREVLHEAGETLDRALRQPEAARALAEALWAIDQPETRVVAARLLGTRVSTEETEEDASRERVRALVSSATAPAVFDALADSLSRAMDAGAADFWSRAYLAWVSDTEPRVRAIGLSAFAHLFGRGRAPEKLFEALQLARRLVADADPTVRRALLALLGAAAKRQSPAVERFLDGLDTDDRSDVKKLVAEARKRLGGRE